LQQFAQQGMTAADQSAANILAAAQSSEAATQLAGEGLLSSADRIGDLSTTTQGLLLGAGAGAQDIAAATAGNVRGLQSPLAQDLTAASAGTRNIAGSGRTGVATATERARASTAQAQASLQEAAQAGRDVSAQGIAALAGTGAMFSPDQAQGFMSSYEDAAVQQALQDIARQGRLQRQDVAASAVRSGAFGGSRQAVAEQELQRNILEQQARTAAQMRAQGFESASQRAQQAFESAQGRQQNVGQLTGQLGLAGVDAAARAAQAGGQLGLSAEGLAQTGSLQGAQLGMSAEQFAAANAQALAQTGLSIEQLAAQTGMSAQQMAGNFAGQAGQMGLSAEQQIQGAQTAQAGLAQGQAQIGMSGAQTAGQMGMAGAELGMSGAQTAGQMGAQAGQMGMQGAQAAGSLGLQGSQLGLSGIQAGLGAQQQAAGLGQGIAGLGQQYMGLGQTGQQLGLQDINTMLTVGQQQQRQEQARLDALRANQMQTAMQPFQQLAFASDIITGAPSGQTATLMQPGPSIGSQLLGLGTAAASTYAGAKAGAQR
jgi:hypothetical protein